MSRIDRTVFREETSDRNTYHYPYLECFSYGTHPKHFFKDHVYNLLDTFVKENPTLPNLTIQCFEQKDGIFISLCCRYGDHLGTLVRTASAFKRVMFLLSTLRIRH